MHTHFYKKLALILVFVAGINLSAALPGNISILVDKSAPAVVNITASTTDTVTGSATLPMFTAFTSTIDNVTYTFNTVNETTALNNGSGGFTFKNQDSTSNITIKEGILKTKLLVYL